MYTRRQFLAHSSLFALATSASWLGYRHLNGTTSVSVNKVGLPFGHLLRDKQFPRQASHHAQCNILILGSGTAAMTAAWQLVKQGERDFLIIEGFEKYGNNAAYTVSGSLKAPTGAHYLAQPSRESRDVRDLLLDLGILKQEMPDGSLKFDDTDLVHAPDERLFYDGAWHDGLTIQDNDTKRFFELVHKLKHAYGSDGKKIFAIPIALSSQDAKWRELDKLTFAEWLKSQKFQSPSLLWYLDYACRDDYGQGIAQVSAFAGLHYFAARGNDEAAVLTWADGLHHIAEKTSQFIQLENLPAFPEGEQWHFRQPASCAAWALQVIEKNENVQVLLYQPHSQETISVSAKKVICAMPLHVAARIVDKSALGIFSGSLPESAPWLVGNFVLKSFPKELKNSQLAWDNVVYGSRGLGYVVATHQHIYTRKPEITAFTSYAALNHDTPKNVRNWLLNADAVDLFEWASADLLTVYGKRFWRHVLHVDLTVRAHAMAVPQVGYLSHEMLLKARQHHSKIVFAHSDLSGYSVFEEAAYWGAEAARKILQAA